MIFLSELGQRLIIGKFTEGLWDKKLSHYIGLGLRSHPNPDRVKTPNGDQSVRTLKIHSENPWFGWQRSHTK